MVAARRFPISEIQAVTVYGSPGRTMREYSISPRRVSPKEPLRTFTAHAMASSRMAATTPPWMTSGAPSWAGLGVYSATTRPTSSSR